MTIVAAVEETSDDGRVLTEGAALADAFGDELHVIHVRDREAIEDEPAGNERSAVERAEDIAADSASAVTDDFSPVGRVGRPVDEIEQYVESSDARYLVLGGRKRSPIGKALFGSVTQSLLLNIDKPVVTVRATEA